MNEDAISSLQNTTMSGRRLLASAVGGVTLGVTALSTAAARGIENGAPIAIYLDWKVDAAKLSTETIRVDYTVTGKDGATWFVLHDGARSPTALYTE